MTVLSVNVNKVALLRNSRGGSIPGVTRAAQTCINAGAGGITVHPRPDCRHIRPDDVYALDEMLSVEYNLEGNPYSEANDRYPGFLKLVEDVKPTQVTLVPDTLDQLTSDHGWNLEYDPERLAAVVTHIKALGCRVSLFMDPEPSAMRLAAGIGADRVELYTEAYARAWGTPEQDAVLSRYRAAASAAQRAGLGLNAGHDLNLDNLATFLSVEGILEVSIGHALISDALEWGLYDTVRRYLDQIPGHL